LRFAQRVSREAARLRLVRAVVVAADVVGDKVLERLQLVEELLRRHLALDGIAAQDVRRRLQRRPPSHLVGLALLLGLVRRIFRQRLDSVQIDVGVAALFGFVELDPGAAALGSQRLASDRLLESRELATLLIREQEARITRARRLRLHVGDGDMASGICA